MIIYLYDGSTMTCEEVEIGRNSIIIDGFRCLSPDEIVRITDGEKED